MGTASSGAAEQAAATSDANELLRTLTGKDHIDTNDVFWGHLCGSSIALPADRSRADELSSLSQSFCVRMVRYNRTSHNFQGLLRVMISKLASARASGATSDQVQQASGCVFLMRTFLKHMLETLEPEDMFPHLVDERCEKAGEPSQAEDTLAEALVESLLLTVADCKLDASTHWLHLEVLSALTVCLSGQLFCELSSPAPLPLVAAAIGYSGPKADRVVLRLLQSYVVRPAAPAASTGLLRSLGTGLWHLPWHVYSYFFRSADAPLPELADRSLQVLLLLTQHLPPTLFPDGAIQNAFLQSLREVGDASAESSDADAEQGQCRTAQLSFRKLHDAIAASLLEQEGAMVLLYLLLHGNKEFLDHTLSRADPDTLLLPILHTLYQTASLRPNRLYMLLIVVLMLSQDEGFVAAAHAVVLPSVPWYKERILHDITLGSLVVVVLARAVQFNLTSLHDSYVHTNCLAALANMSPSFRKLHPHAARCIVSLYDLLSRKLLKLSAAQAEMDGGRETAVAVAEAAAHAEARNGGFEGSRVSSGCSLMEAEALAEELSLYGDFVRMSLEVINVVLSQSLSHNEHLVYALLERKTLFNSLAAHPLFRELISNVLAVISHFGAGLDADAGGEAVWSVERVLAHIRVAARTWSAEGLHKLPDPKFTYEQEASPEEFFTPYIWLIVFEQSGLAWQTSRVTMLPQGGAEDDGAAELPEGLPVLSIADVDAVDEGAINEGGRDGLRP